MWTTFSSRHADGTVSACRARPRSTHLARPDGHSAMAPSPFREPAGGHKGESVRDQPEREQGGTWARGPRPALTTAGDGKRVDSACLDGDVQLGRDLRVQAHRDGVGADGLDLAGHLHGTPVERRAAGRTDGLDDVGRGDRAEETARVARRLGPDGDREPAELAGDLLGVAEVADLT